MVLEAESTNTIQVFQKKMTKQEYIEWALEDILTEVDENTDIIVSHLVASKDCICPITRQMMEAVSKLIDRYDFVIFDCEYDLKYLVQLVDYPIDTTLFSHKRGFSITSFSFNYL